MQKQGIGWGRPSVPQWSVPISSGLWCLVHTERLHPCPDCSFKALALFWSLLEDMETVLLLLDRGCGPLCDAVLWCIIMRIRSFCLPEMQSIESFCSLAPDLSGVLLGKWPSVPSLAQCFWLLCLNERWEVKRTTKPLYGNIVASQAWGAGGFSTLSLLWCWTTRRCTSEPQQWLYQFRCAQEGARVWIEQHQFVSTADNSPLSSVFSTLALLMMDGIS